MDNNGSPLHRSVSDVSLHSDTSETPLNAIPEPIQDGDGTTFFLLNVNDESSSSKKPINDDDEKSDSSTDSSSSSVSAQVVIDHGSSIPRRMEKNGLGHLMRSGDDESESDYAFCYTPQRRESDAESITKRTHLNIMEPYEHETDLSAAENDGDDDLDEDEVRHGKKSKKRRRHHKHHKGKHVSPRKGMVTVYTEEDDDLVDEMPTGDRERMLRHSDKFDRRRSLPRRLHKRTQRVLRTNLQSQSWSRRESLQSSRHPGLSSEDALK